MVSMAILVANLKDYSNEIQLIRSCAGGFLMVPVIASGAPMFHLNDHATGNDAGHKAFMNYIDPSIFGGFIIKKLTPLAK
jgi:hypothetical protein